ncbi:type I methionyl aminopeptidase [Phototrophicus methaneseepsis]|uniref:Methionine aminopeptidase n=1 Tax=Phototrophicus methaneseepsis TaxID=2710758 RepID=A0A7S8ED97_9CHLR|nr:type I methionyl aminopeptidase [Phototrophicus methaneseepsis]QPC84819.1 type I methionyl aminopeptidase [Phototrophicus methaneseepsis]
MPQVTLKTPEEIEIMREAGKIVAEVLQTTREALRPGISTKELDTIAETIIRDHGATPAFLDYAPGGHPPYPATITASINNELVHGIPSESRILQEGDIVSIDVACFHKGYVGDAAYTAGVGEVAPSVERLLRVTVETLWQAIELCVPGNHISDIARMTSKYASQHGYSVASEYTGHGVGTAMHEPPQVPNWWPRKLPRGMRGPVDYELKPGMTFAIEPMLIAGRNELMELEDGWTVVTKDGSLNAHTEHTVAITDGEPLVLTLP